MEARWGDTTRDLVESTQKLADEHWEEIMKECKPFLPRCVTGDNQSNEDHPDGGHRRSEMHASIQVDW